jgi:hypothetical protein
MVDNAQQLLFTDENGVCCGDSNVWQFDTLKLEWILV